MMKVAGYLAIAVCLALAGWAGGSAWLAHNTMDAASADAPPRNAAASASMAADARRRGDSATDLLNSPQARAYRERTQFHERARRFFAQAARLDAAARAQQAQLIEDDASRYERAGELSAGEALLLRIGLIKAMGLDEREQAERMGDLMERYRVESERRSAAWAQQQRRDPRFRSYKANERGIVEEVMAMRTIPDGLSRDEYLRRRLQQARESTWHPEDPL